MSSLPPDYGLPDELRLAALEPVTAMRCAECDCQNGGDDCAWIKAAPDPAAIREAALREAAQIAADCGSNAGRHASLALIPKGAADDRATLAEIKGENRD